jgi:hypothetical protein
MAKVMRCRCLLGAWFGHVVVISISSPHILKLLLDKLQMHPPIVSLKCEPLNHESPRLSRMLFSIEQTNGRLIECLSKQLSVLLPASVAPDEECLLAGK